MVYQQQQQGQYVFYANEGYDRISSIYNVSSNVSMVPPSPPEPNVPIHIENYERDELIVYSSNYKFTLEIDQLLTNSSTCRRATRGKKSGPPRPQNSYILYLRDTTARIKQDPEFSKEHPSKRSKIIGKMWKNEPQSVKDLFESLAKLARKNHLNTYQNYQYKPSKAQKKNSVEQKSQTPPLSESIVSTPVSTPVSSSPTLDFDAIFDLNLYYDNSSHDSHGCVSPLAVHKVNPYKPDGNYFESVFNDPSSDRTTL
ncbi:11657_t:CDS:1 [Funneliformis geosporum]|uniref:1182_t:CDS:1 n=1 Tax=Funneliformis geosporum TaxID=1117311 RepID=A0A9W4SKB5_9GLOM|nr:1182_t:CDS:1 [Funneliformis geosporum]CAI2172940.1 11657_t:CDS:1 [Funneliformis geosporum]